MVRLLNIIIIYIFQVNVFWPKVDIQTKYSHMENFLIHWNLCIQ